MCASFMLVVLLCLDASRTALPTSPGPECEILASSARRTVSTKSNSRRRSARSFSCANPKTVAQAIFNVNNRFPGSKPWVTWVLVRVRDAEEISDAAHLKCLSEMDRLGVDVFLEIAPEKSDVLALLEEWNGKFKQHSSIKGFSVDLEFFKPATDEMARLRTRNQVAQSELPSDAQALGRSVHAAEVSRQGRLDLHQHNSEASIDGLNSGFAKWAQRFYPSAVAFQIGYPADEDGLDGTAMTGWWKLKDPIKDWGRSLLAGMKDPDQQIGLFWVCEIGQDLQRDLGSNPRRECAEIDVALKQTSQSLRLFRRNSSLITLPLLAIFIGRPFLLVNVVSSEMPSALQTVAITSCEVYGSVSTCGAVFVGLADRDAALDARAADHHAPRPGPVIAAGVAVDARRAAEFAHPDDGGVFAASRARSDRSTRARSSPCRAPAASGSSDVENVRCALSQPPSSTSTNGTPASTSRRAIKQPRPKPSLPYLSCTAFGSFVTLKASICLLVIS